MKKMKPILLILFTLCILSACDQEISLPKEIEFYEPAYSALWLVGDAVPAGWDIDNPTPMVVNPENLFEFTWEGELKAGQFKIPTETGEWGCNYYMPSVNGEEISVAVTVEHIEGGDPDNKWVVTESGAYKIVLNIRPPISIQFTKM